MKLWMQITPDKYQLPVQIADSAEELADLTGASLNVIRSTASKLIHGKQKNGSYISVVINDEEGSETS